MVKQRGPRALPFAFVYHGLLRVHGFFRKKTDKK